MDRCTLKFLFIILPEQIEQAAGQHYQTRRRCAGLAKNQLHQSARFATTGTVQWTNTPAGSGAGMVLKAEPMVAAIRSNDSSYLQRAGYYM